MNNNTENRKKDGHSVMRYALIDVLSIKDPTEDQIQKLYSIIPMELVRDAMNFWYGDEAIFEEICLFIRENLEQVKEAIR